MQSFVFIQWCLEHLNYWVIMLLMAIESSFIPFPSEIVVPPAAWMAGVSGELNVFLVIVAATVGADCGALINYYLARWLGRPLVYRFVNSKLGHLCLLDEQKMRHAETYFDRHGAVSTFVGRLVPAVRQLISIPAGIARMSLGRFLLYTTLGAGIWNTVLAGIGYYLSTVSGIDSPEAVADTAATYSHEIGYGIIALVSIGILYIVWRTRRHK